MRGPANEALGGLGAALVLLVVLMLVSVPDESEPVTAGPGEGAVSATVAAPASLVYRRPDGTRLPPRPAPGDSTIVCVFIDRGDRLEMPISVAWSDSSRIRPTGASHCVWVVEPPREDRTHT